MADFGFRLSLWDMYIYILLHTVFKCTDILPGASLADEVRLVIIRATHTIAFEDFFYDAIMA